MISTALLALKARQEGSYDTIISLDGFCANVTAGCPYHVKHYDTPSICRKVHMQGSEQKCKFLNKNTEYDT